MDSKLKDTAKSVITGIEKDITKLKNMSAEQYLEMFLDILNGAVDKEFEIVRFVQNYKPFMPQKITALAEANAFIKKNKIKVKRKRKFGIITIFRAFKGNKEKKDWLNSNSTIGNTIYLSNDWESNSPEQKGVKLVHELNHWILSKKMKVVYETAYLANDYFRLAIELCCYKTNFLYSGKNEMYMKNLIMKLEDMYEINVRNLEKIVRKSLE